MSRHTSTRKAFLTCWCAAFLWCATASTPERGLRECSHGHNPEILNRRDATLTWVLLVLTILGMAAGAALAYGVGAAGVLAFVETDQGRHQTRGHILICELNRV